jgi:MFS family permease
MRVNRAWLGLVVLMLPTLLVAMDMTALLLALPRLSAGLGATNVQQLWITDSYGLMVAGLVITMGTLGDRIGRRRLLMIGAAAFAALSVAAAFAVSPLMLIVARAAGRRRRDPGAVHACPDHQHVPRRTAARAGHRDLGDLPVHWRRARARTRRIPAGALLVGIGVPGRRAGDGGQGAELLHAAREAFTASLHVTGVIAAVIFAGLAVLILIMRPATRTTPAALPGYEAAR